MQVVQRVHARELAVCAPVVGCGRGFALDVHVAARPLLIGRFGLRGEQMCGHAAGEVAVTCSVGQDRCMADVAACTHAAVSAHARKGVLAFTSMYPDAACWPVGSAPANGSAYVGSAPAAPPS